MRGRYVTLKPYAPGGAGPLSRYRTAALVCIGVAGALYGALYTLLVPFMILELALPLVLIALAVVWALPESKVVPTRALSGLFFAFFVGMILWPDYLALSLPGLPWITLRRIIALPMAITLLICLSTSGRFRSELKDVLDAIPMQWKLLLALVTIQFFSIFLSRDPALSIDKFVIAQLYWTSIFFAGCWIFSQPGRVGRWAGLLCLMLIPLGLIAISEWVNSRVPWAGHIPSFLAIEDESVQRVLTGATRAASGIYRVQSTFTTSLGFAEFMALTVPFLIHFAVTSRRFFVRVAAIAGLPITFFLIIITDSRLGIVGFFLAVLFYGLGWAALRWRRERESLFGPAIVLVYPMVFVAFIIGTFTIGRLRHLVWGSGAEQYSTDARSEQYRMGFDILMSNPLGHGIGLGAETLGFRNLAGVLTIDTYYLVIALEYGVIGFFIYYGMLLLTIYRGGEAAMTKADRDPEQHYLLPAVIALSNFVVIKSIFSIESSHPLAFMLMAMIAALVAKSRGRDVAAPA